MVWTQQHPANAADYNWGVPDCKSLIAEKPANQQNEQAEPMAKTDNMMDGTVKQG
jgi:hypothetical protein